VATSRYDPATREAGRHARAIVRRLRMRTLITLGVTAVATALFGRTFGWRDPVFMASAVGLLSVIFAVSRFVLPLVDRHDRGATGEEQVGALLDGLSQSGWRVFHDASFGNGNVDHILIGPAGLFTVETKSHPGPIKVARLHGATFAQAEAQRRILKQITDEPVEPLIVFSRAWVDRPLARRRGVRVLPARMLVHYLTRAAAKLDADQIEDLQQQVTQALLASARRERNGLRAGH
jgi:Nuclease-related domain